MTRCQGAKKARRSSCLEVGYNDCELKKKWKTEV